MDLNPHSLRYWNLNPARLPVPPRARGPRAAAYSKDRPMGNPQSAGSLGARGDFRCSRTRLSRRSPGPTSRSRPSPASRHPSRPRPRHARPTSTSPRPVRNHRRRRFRRWVLVIPALSRDLPSLQRQWRKAEVFREIAPRWIYLVDQIVFPCAGPTFNPLLPQDRRFHRFMTLKPHEPLDSIPLSKSSNEPLAVLHTRPGKSDVTPV